MKPSSILVTAGKQQSAIGGSTAAPISCGVKLDGM